MNAKSISETDAATDGDAYKFPCDGPQPIVKAREEHTISRRDIDPDALKVLYRLARNNYIAYLVGGGVRDLLLGRVPKDFDISTNAKPEQIRSLFRNCILIGRRFRLAHIRYGEKIIETSTFRTTPKQQADPSDPDADLFQRDDNLFGTPAEDALRRDFTVNGLFYDIESFSIIDYVGGMEDLAARRIRSIGDPCIRFREDPVRMIRAVRFASRLGFTLDPETEEAIHQYGSELTKASPARLLEEITRLFAFASGEKAVRLLRSTGLLEVILPEVDACLDSGDVDQDLFWNRLRALDCGDTVLPDASPSLIFSVLLMDSMKLYLEKSWTFETTPRLRFDKLYSFLQPLAQRLRFPKKMVDRIIHMYLNQNRFCGHSVSRGKPGSLSNFVMQDAFHESLALAEIVLASEGGEPTRLNQWREMLQERIYGREEHSRNGHHHSAHGSHGAAHAHGAAHGTHSGGAASSGGNGSGVAAGSGKPDSANGNSGGSGGRTHQKQAQPAAEVKAVDASNGQNDELPGHKLSRSARRRRNKRMRRLQSDRPDEVSASDSSVSFVVETEETEVGDKQVEAVNSAEKAKPSDKSGRSEKSEKPEKVEKASRVEKAEKGEKSAKDDSTEKSAPAAKAGGRSGRRTRKPASRSEKSAAKTDGATEEKVKAAGETPEKAGAKDSEKKASSAEKPKTGSAGSVRKGRGGKADVRKGSGKAEAGASEEKSDVPPPKPLTAAAFWKDPDPEPEAEKKTRGRGKKSGSESKGKEKGKAADGKSKEKTESAPKPLAMDKADEADIPMHWLDEI